MRRFVTLNCLVDNLEAEPFPSDAIQSLRRTLLAPLVYRPVIHEALKNVNFQFHRTCSFYNIIRECNVCEGETLLMFWGRQRSDSRLTMSVSASSCSSLLMPANPPPSVVAAREKEVRCAGTQTDISCRVSAAGGVLPRLPDPLPLACSPAPSLLPPAPGPLPPAARSTSILGSVCALLLNTQPAASPKEAGSVCSSLRSEHICRICFGGESAERLVRPCSCRGTIAAVHRSCLERWLLQAATSYCELCRHHYVVTRSHKWSWARSVVEWARSGRGRALAADLWRALALGAASVLGTARALHACDAVLQAGARRGGTAALAANLFSSLLIGVIGALNGLLTTWMLLKIQEHQVSWRAWRDSTLHVHVTLAEESERGSDTTVVAAGARADRATNVADPFLLAAALPFAVPPDP